MAKLSDLVAVMARLKIDSVESLNQFARALREEGRVSKAKRGFGAAEVTFLDAARLLIAAGATDRPTRAADAERHFSGSRVHPIYSDAQDLPFVEAIVESSPTLDQALASILEHMATGTDWHHHAPWLCVERSTGGAKLQFGLSSVRFDQPAAIEHSRSIERALKRGEGLPGDPVEVVAANRFGDGKNLKAEFPPQTLLALANCVAGILQRGMPE